METWQGKHFSITDPEGVNTVIYQINKTPKEYMKDYPKYTVDRLDYTEELRGNMKRKTFYVDFPTYEDELLILSFAKDKVVVNTAIMADDKISISKKPMPLKCDSIYSEEEKEVKDFKYTPNLKRPICIIDPETTEEDVDVCYETIDYCKNKLKGFDKNSKLLDYHNDVALVAVIAYAIKNEIDLDKWIVSFSNQNNTYPSDTKENYTYMLNSLKQFTNNVVA